jgi:hypothetical protein
LSDSWGGSWGSSWGTSWGSGGVTPPTPTPTPTPEAPTQTALGGGFGTERQPRRIDYVERDRIANQLRDLYREVYAKAKPDSAAADEAAALVSNYAPAKGPDLPPPPTVDWVLIAEEGAQAVAAFREALIRIQEMLAEQDDEEVLLILMLAD